MVGDCEDPHPCLLSSEPMGVCPQEQRTLMTAEDPNGGVGLMVLLSHTGQT